MILVILAVVVLTIFGIVAFAASRGSKAPQMPPQRMPEPWPVPTAPKVTLSPAAAPVPLALDPKGMMHSDQPYKDGANITGQMNSSIDPSWFMNAVTPQVETNWQREVDPGAGKEKL